MILLHSKKEWLRVFYYHDGKLYWRNDTGGKAKAGDLAGTKSDRGYWRVKYKGKSYRNHRIVWEMFYGDIPEGMYIDHINHNTSDNRIENLRLVTPAENQYNQSKRKGWHLHKATGKWNAMIRVDGYQRHLGLFDTEKEAECAYLTAKEELHIYGTK